MKTTLLAGFAAIAMSIAPLALAHADTTSQTLGARRSQNLELSYDQMTFKPASVIRQESLAAQQQANRNMAVSGGQWQQAPVNLAW